MTLADKIVMGQMMLAIGVAPQRGTTTAEARRKIYLSSQHSSLALRSALWRLERAQAARARAEIAKETEFLGSEFGQIMGAIGDFLAEAEKMKEGDKK